MKNSFSKHKFKNINFVKPLYRKVSKVKPKTQSVALNVDNNKLHGDGLWLKRKIFRDKSVDFDLTSIKRRSSRFKYLPGECQDINIISDIKINGNMHDDEVFSVTNNRLGNVVENNIGMQENKMEKSVQANNKLVFSEKNTACWLKVFPAPQSPGDTICSIIFRCLVCQLGLASFLVLWTMIWVFIINAYEEPHEHKVSREFERQQNQLVIDLATELRQITPLSPRWKEAIERRIEDERKLTMKAVGRGAILHPGHYWKPSGTLLFTVYVMTALGFGAPVPQTLWGRTAALVYAVLAVPTHIYLRSPTCSRNSDVMKARKSFREKMLNFLSFLCVGRCVPFAAVLYYTLGSVAFGVLRGKMGLDVAMFPLEFTTSGGLEHVEEHVRFLYGFYVEGAMILLSCILAAIRLHSTAAASSVADHYKLFVYETID
ncbi:uncharacterized protein LOC132903127 [Amyelois transitella]|uniref:uncharacterized protein LOC132903127 n=1 Tax=Amyelois transitella TaxID=680683 RepID=UPI00298F4BFC|nr:uncharacterized protein LOC132903127 [Amyelois transitella]